MQMAMDYFMRLLRTNRQPAAQQEAYIKEFLHVCEQYAASLGGVLPRTVVGVPEFLPSSARLTSLKPDQRHLGTSSELEPEETWLGLEESLVEYGLNAKGRVARPIVASRRSAADVVGAVGGEFCRRTLVFSQSLTLFCPTPDLEPLYLAITLRNPLAVPISLHNIDALCTFGDKSSSEPPLDELSRGSPKIDSQTLDRIDLEPDQTRTVSELQFCVLPPHVASNSAAIPLTD